MAPSNQSIGLSDVLAQSDPKLLGPHTGASKRVRAHDLDGDHGASIRSFCANCFADERMNRIEAGRELSKQGRRSYSQFVRRHLVDAGLQPSPDTVTVGFVNTLDRACFVEPGGGVALLESTSGQANDQQQGSGKLGSVHAGIVTPSVWPFPAHGQPTAWTAQQIAAHASQQRDELGEALL